MYRVEDETSFDCKSLQPGEWGQLAIAERKKEKKGN